jgi:hypothetical protein
MSESKAVWTDRHGTTHRVAFTVRQAMQIKEHCGLDLLATLHATDHVDPVLTRLAENPSLVLAVLSIVESIAEKDLNAFYDLFDGDAFQAASEALIWGLIDFFPSRPRRILLAILKRTQSQWAAIGDQAEQEIIEKINQPEFTSVLSQSMTHGSGSKS